MILGAFSPVMEIVTLGGVAIGVTAAIMIFVCSPKGRGRDESKCDGTECDHEHQWTKATAEPCPSSSRIAHYGTLSISAQNSPTRHLRSISATNPPTHFLSPSHVRTPRRNSSPVPQNQLQLGTHTRIMHPHVLELTSHPVQPPYWDPESQQYYYSYSHETSIPSPKRKVLGRGNQNVASSPSSTPTFSRRSPCTNMNNPCGLQQSFGNTNATKRSSDYTNLFLPQAPNKQTLFDPFANSPRGRARTENWRETHSPPSEREDVLQVSQDSDKKLRLVLTKRMPIPTICKTPPEDKQDGNGNGTIDSAAHIIIGDSGGSQVNQMDNAQKHVIMGNAEVK